jgi:hypothetical protein
MSRLYLKTYPESRFPISILEGVTQMLQLQVRRRTVLASTSLLPLRTSLFQASGGNVYDTSSRITFRGTRLLELNSDERIVLLPCVLLPDSLARH